MIASLSSHSQDEPLPGYDALSNDEVLAEVDLLHRERRAPPASGDAKR